MRTSVATERRASSGPRVRAGIGGEKHRLALQRLQAKQQVIGELLNGRLTLLQAASRWRGLQPEGIHDGPEQMCRAVIGWAHLALRERPERAEAFCAALESDLETHLARYGSVLLPCS